MSDETNRSQPHFSPPSRVTIALVQLRCQAAKPANVEKGIFGISPFESLDREGVGRLVKIAVKDKSDTVKELVTLASAQPTNRDLEYQFVAVLDPGTYKLSVVVTLTSGQKASGSSRCAIHTIAEESRPPAH